MSRGILWARHFLGVGLLVFSLDACGAHSRPIVYDRDACAFCRMTISDRRFGAEVVTAQGRVRTFDSIECLAAFVVSQGGDAAPQTILVTDYDHPGSFVPAQTARFLRVRGPSSPMSGGLLAFAANADAATLMRRSGGDTLGWTDVLEDARQDTRKATSLARSRAVTPRVE